MSEVDGTLCRGCAGTGLRYDHPGFTLAQQPIHVPSWTTDGPHTYTARTIPGCGQLAPYNPGTGTPRKTAARWSMYDVERTHRWLCTIGATPERDLNFALTDACPWCAGHGRSNTALTVHAMQTAIEGAVWSRSSQ